MNTIQITYFVHSSTPDSEKGIATGWLPGELSPSGINQATELGTIVSGKKFDAVFCSDLNRAVVSATLIFGEKHQIIQDERLRECNYGDFNGKPASTFKNKLHNYVEIPFPGGESYRAVENRMAAFLEMLKKSYQGKNIAIVAHQAPQLALDVLIHGKHWKQAIDEDWRKKGAWQPGWAYTLKCQH